MRSLALSLAVAAACLAPRTASAQPVPREARQLVVVTTPSWTAVEGTLRRYERRAGGTWRALGAAVPVNVGRSGLGWGRGLHGTLAPAGLDGPTKREGDGRAPAGVFRLPSAFGYPASLRTGLPYRQATDDVECVDDTTSALYNRIVSRDTTGAPYASHEEMRRPDALYRAGVTVAHNGLDGALPTSPTGGSCIFLHLWSGPGRGTAGCTAMNGPALDALVGWLDASKAPVLVQLTADGYRRLRRAWRLP